MPLAFLRAAPGFRLEAPVKQGLPLEAKQLARQHNATLEMAETIEFTHDAAPRRRCVCFVVLVISSESRQLANDKTTENVNQAPRSSRLVAQMYILAQ